MQNQLRGRSLTARLTLIDEDEKSSSPSYFEWCEQTIRTRAYQPTAKPRPKVKSLARLFRRFV